MMQLNANRFSGAWILPCISILLSAAVVYLFGVYGSLTWFWLQLRRDGYFGDKQVSSFLEKADILHILAIIMAFLNLGSAIVVWRGKVTHNSLGLAAVVLAACALLVCLLVSV
jgi:hypothetical protein